MRRFFALAVVAAFVIFLALALDWLITKGGLYALVSPLVLFGSLGLFFAWASAVKRYIQSAAQIRQFAMRCHHRDPHEFDAYRDLAHSVLIGEGIKDFGILSLSLVGENEQPKQYVFALSRKRAVVASGFVGLARKSAIAEDDAPVRSGAHEGANFLEFAR